MHRSLDVAALDTGPYTVRQANEPWIQTAAVGVTAFIMGKLRVLDALIRRILPVRLDAPDADAPDAYYPNPYLITGIWLAVVRIA